MIGSVLAVRSIELLVGLLVWVAVAGAAASQTYDYPGDYAQRFDGVDPAKEGSMKAGPHSGAKGYNPETLRRSLQPKSGAPQSGDVSRPFILGPLWNPKDRPAAGGK